MFKVPKIALRLDDEVRPLLHKQEKELGVIFLEPKCP